MTHRKMRVFLIIEAGEVALSSRKLLAESAGYNVLSAISAKQAFALVDQHPVDLAIVDVQVHDIPLRDILIEIKRRFPDIPLYLMTPQSWPPEEVKDLIDGFFEKMLDPEIMIKELERRFP
jgi:DNA-binding NtrC family response regulator